MASSCSVSVFYATQRRHRLKLKRLRDDVEATQTAIVQFYERRLLDPGLSGEMRLHYEKQMDAALELLGAIFDG